MLLLCQSQSTMPTDLTRQAIDAAAPTTITTEKILSLNKKTLFILF